MKYLIALCAIQTALLVFFGARIMAIDARTDEMTVVAAAAETAQAAVAASSDGWKDSSLFKEAPPGSGASIEEIRQVIREEVDLLAARMSAENRQSSGSEEDRAARAEMYANSAELSASLQQDLSYYIGRGRISEREMANLQLKIARLPPNQRGAALSQLTKAMSDGLLEGQL